MAEKITLRINERDRGVEVPANATLLETLRELGYVEVKSGCEKGDCGACAVLVDGVALDSCLTLTWTVAERAVTTVAGLGDSAAPHFSKASINGCLESARDKPATVVTARPSTVQVSVRQLSTASPSTSTAQAPQSPFSQPLLTSK